MCVPCAIGWVDFGLFICSTKIPLRFVEYPSKITKIATKTGIPSDRYIFIYNSWSRILDHSLCTVLKGSKTFLILKSKNFTEIKRRRFLRWFKKSTLPYQTKCNFKNLDKNAILPQFSSISKKYVTVTSFSFLEPAENCNGYIVPHVWIVGSFPLLGYKQITEGVRL
jgi:hypothetical protein